MTRTFVAALPHDLAVIAALESIDGDHPVGFALAPEGALEAVRSTEGNHDYMILYPLNSTRDGSLGDAWSDADLAYQVTCVGRLPAGARWLADRIESALLGIEVAGRKIVNVIPDDSGQVRIDTDVQPPVYLATPRFTLQSVPT